MVQFGGHGTFVFWKGFCWRFVFRYLRRLCMRCLPAIIGCVDDDDSFGHDIVNLNVIFRCIVSNW